MPQPLWLSRLPFKDVLNLVILQVCPCAIGLCIVLLFNSLGLGDDDDGDSCGGDVDYASEVFVSRILLSLV